MTIQIPEIFEPLFSDDYRIKVTHGGRGSAKTESIARWLLISGCQRNERILCTREIQKTIATSSHQTLKDIINQFQMPYIVYEATIRSLINDTRFIFTGLRDNNSQNVKSIKGITKCWVEEAQTVSRASLDVLDPSIREENSQLIFSMNRTEELDPVFEKYAAVPDRDTLVIFANWWNNPFFPKVLNKSRLKCKAEDSPATYAHIWEGVPLSQSETSALSMAEIRKAMDRDVKAEGPVRIGVDVARGGGDAISVYKSHGFKCIDHWEATKEMHPDEIVARTDAMEGPPPNEIRVDDTAMGWAVSLAFEKKYGKSKVNAINFASKEGIDKTKYPDFISHMYFEFGKMLPELDLPFDLELLKELSARQYHFKNPLKLRQVESKDDFKLRLKRSPDNSDALLLCFVGKPKKELIYF